MHNRDNISVCIICKNAIRTIERCIASALLVADDVIVLDSGSTDGTLGVIKSTKANLINTEWLGYGATKNNAASLAKNDWILSIDSDEILSSDLVETINNLQLKKENIYLLDRYSNYCGKWVNYSGWQDDWITRLYNKEQISWNLSAVHEHLIIPSNTKQKKLKGKLHHYSFFTQQEHIAKTNHYAYLAALRDHNKNKKISLAKRYFGASFRFIKTYILRLGFLDGSVGYRLAKHNARYIKKYIEAYDQITKGRDI